MQQAAYMASSNADQARIMLATLSRKPLREVIAVEAKYQVRRTPKTVTECVIALYLARARAVAVARKQERRRITDSSLT